MEKPDRIVYIDLAKFFAIFCVICGHVYQWTFPGDPYHESPCFQFIYSFHMPLFMALSGLFLGKSFEMSPLAFLKKRFVQLLLPVLGFSVVFVLFYNFVYAKWMGVANLDFFTYLGGGDMWFLKYLFVCSAIAYASKKIFRMDAWAALLPVMLLLTLTRSNIFRLLPFLWLGYFLYKYRAGLLEKHLRATLAGSLATFAFFLCFWKGDYDAPIRFLYLKPPVHIDAENFFATFVRQGVGISGSVFFIALFKVISRKINVASSRLATYCCTAGQNTLGIYCLQIYILEFGLDHLNFRFAYAGDVLVRCLMAIVILLVCDALVRLLARNKWTSLFFLGRGKGQARTK